MGRLLVLLLLIGCGPRGGASSGDPGAIHNEEIRAEVLDGIVLWVAPLDGAPAPVQDRIALVRLQVETIDAAPSPPFTYEERPDEWIAWIRASTEVEFARYGAAVQAYLETDGADHAAAARILSPDELRLYTVLIELVEYHQLARYLMERGIVRPALGSCTASPDEQLGNFLNNVRDAAEECVELTSKITGPLATNLAACRRRAAWSRDLIATGVHGVCEPPDAD